MLEVIPYVWEFGDSIREKLYLNYEGQYKWCGLSLERYGKVTHKNNYQRLKWWIYDSENRLPYSETKF